MDFIHDKPRSQGVINACKRARQMVELRWTPVREIPCSYKIRTPEGKRQIDGMLAPWRPRCGIVYSGVRRHEKYVGFNVSFETFATAVANPNSVLYTRSLHGEGKNTSAYYGNVCSAFVSYALDWPYMVTCAEIPFVKGVSEVDTTDLDVLQLCDIVLNASSHVVIITDILRDENGKIHTITVSESTLPLCITTPFSAEAFRQFYLNRGGYKVYRYDGVDAVSYTPTPYVRQEGDPEVEPEAFPVLMTNFGNKANCLKSVDAVELSIFEADWDMVEVTLPDGTISKYPVVDGKVNVDSGDVGFHSACCIKEGNKRSHSVQWCVVDVAVTTDKKVYKKNEPIHVTFSSAAAEDRAIACLVKNKGDYNRKRWWLSEEEASAGKLIIEQNERMRQSGELSVEIVFQNQYGKYTSRRAFFTIEGENAAEAVTDGFAKN